MSKQSGTKESKTWVRCPNCGEENGAASVCPPALHEPGPTAAWCPDCDFHYTIETVIRRAYISPPMNAKEQT